MAYDTHLAERIDRIFADRKLAYHHLKMMGGLCYMLDEKMCCSIIKKQLMARVGPVNYQQCLTNEGCSEMNFTGRGLKGYIFVDQNALDMDSELAFYIDLCIQYNPEAKRSKKK